MTEQTKSSTLRRPYPQRRHKSKHGRAESPRPHATYAHEPCEAVRSEVPCSFMKPPGSFAPRAGSFSTPGVTASSCKFGVEGRGWVQGVVLTRVSSWIELVEERAFVFPQRRMYLLQKRSRIVGGEQDPRREGSSPENTHHMHTENKEKKDLWSQAFSLTQRNVLQPGCIE